MNVAEIMRRTHTKLGIIATTANTARLKPDSIAPKLLSVAS
jgi:hypothetical protein